MTEPATPELADSPATPPTAAAPAWQHALVQPLVTSDPTPEDPVPPATVEPPGGSGYWPDPNRYPPEQVERYLSEGRRRLCPTMRTFNLIAIGLGLVLLTVLLVAYNYHKNA
ncbi:MAG TPA: hypothetical protein VGJ07_29715, partial [Rugosimonospora sp.]